MPLYSLFCMRYEHGMKEGLCFSAFKLAVVVIELIRLPCKRESHHGGNRTLRIKITQCKQAEWHNGRPLHGSKVRSCLKGAALF